MTLVTRFHLGAALVLVTGCGRSQPAPPAQAVEVKRGPEPQTASQERLGSLELPTAVPASASAVFSVRQPSALVTAILDAGLERFPAGTPVQLGTDLDAVLVRAVNHPIRNVARITGFGLGDRDFALLLSGVERPIHSTQVDERRGTPVFGEKDSALRLAKVDGLLVVGTERGVDAAIDAAGDEEKSARGGELAAFVADATEGAQMVLAVDLDALHPSFLGEIPEVARVRRGMLVLRTDTATLHVEGGAKQVEAVAMALSRLVRATGTAPTSLSDEEFLAAVVEGNQLTVEFPMESDRTAQGVAMLLPAVAKFMRRSRASEAVPQLHRIADAAYSAFESVGTDEPSTKSVVHKCPNDGALSGQTGLTPPLTVDCSRGTGGRCRAAHPGGQPAEYPVQLWSTDVWDALNFQREQGHFFHYNFIWKNAESGFGACQFTAQAFGDLDGDGVFSTYERYGAVDADGRRDAAGLFIDRSLE